MKLSTALLALVLAASALPAQDQVREFITFDRVTIEASELFYQEDKRNLNLLYPDRSYVDLVNFRPMSSNLGNRYALVTLKNQLNSTVHLDEKQFVGILANGMRVFPRKYEGQILSAETQSIVLDFGYREMPLVKILIDND